MDKFELAELKEFMKNFNLLNVLGEGSFGEVWKAEHRQVGKSVAIKFSKIPNSIEHEYKIYRLIKSREPVLFSVKPIPTIFGFGNVIGLTWLAMDLLGPSIDDLYKKLGMFTKKTILMMGLKMIECLEYLHRCGIVHGDIKGDNFALSANNPQNIVIMDFGLARDIESVSTDFHGSLSYASIAMHERKRVSFKDDIESLGYMLSDYHKKLPWRNVKWPECFEDRIEFGLEQKKQKNIFAMTPDFFEMTLFLMHVDAKNRPSTKYLREMFR